MSNRTLRVSELVQREISAYLHTRHQAEALRITITAVRVAPDLRDARVSYAVLGGAAEAEEAGRWLAAHAGEIRRVVGRAVVLKQVPRLEFERDTSAERGVRVNRLIDEIASGEHPAPPGEG